MRRIALVIPLFLIPCVAQQLKCAEGHVHYSQPTAEIQKDVRLETSKARIEGEWTKSPQATREVVRSVPDFMQPGPWNSVFVFKDVPNQKELMRIGIHNHGNTIVGHWLNERLYFIQVWWGRIASSDIIVDVEEGKITSLPIMARSHTAMEPRRQANTKIKSVTVLRLYKIIQWSRRPCWPCT